MSAKAARWRDLARTRKYNPGKRRRLPEPRYQRSDKEFEELNRDETAEKFLKSDTGEDSSAIKGFQLRRSKEPFEAAKEKREEEKSLRQPEYGKVKRTKRRFAKRK